MDICSDYSTSFNDSNLPQPDCARQVRDWFAARGWTPFEFQREAWRAFIAGQSGLIHAPTGIGKTYAAWFGPLLEWMSDEPDQPCELLEASAAPLTVLWITPLRALAVDLQATLYQTVKDLQLPWSVECRTGDTTQSAKNRQKKKSSHHLDHHAGKPEPSAFISRGPGKIQQPQTSSG